MNKFTVIAKKSTFWEVVDGTQKRIAKARFDAIIAQKIVKVEYHETETIYHVEERETVDLFSFAELSEVAQERIIEENRNILVEYNDWFEHLKDDFHQALELLGFSDVVSNFSGFGSQGDGASFTADWDAENIVNNPEKWQSLKAFEYFKSFIDKLSKLGGKAQIKRNRSLYLHARTCFVEADDAELESVLDALRIDCCNKYYNKLWVEYDYLTSDDAIRDYFLNCDWLKYTKNGLCVNN